jgi:NPCBM/NEW2 domain
MQPSPRSAESPDVKVRRRPPHQRSDPTVRVALISATATVLVAVIGGVSAFAVGWLQYRGPGAAAQDPGTAPPASASSPTGTTPPGLPSPGAAKTGSYLADLKLVEGHNVTDLGRRAVSGSSYEHSVALGNFCIGAVRQAGFNLDRRYRRFQAVMGLSDETPSAFELKFRVLLDDKPLASSTLKVGQVERLDLDVSGGLRLLLSAEASTLPGCDREVKAEAVWGDARVV